MRRDVLKSLKKKGLEGKGSGDGRRAATVPAMDLSAGIEWKHTMKEVSRPVS